MGFGKSVKNLFWRSGNDEEAEPPAEADDAEELSEEDFAAMLADSPHTVPADAVDPVEVATVAVSTNDSGVVGIDFQAQYDAAGIPDTDEVAQLENFLERLDNQLPHASKIAAAQAFLGAIGKDKKAVLADAERKIRRVHGIVQSKQQEAADSLAAQQAAIDTLQSEIDGHRQRMQAINTEVEGVRKACSLEESRLQAARIFFGEVNPPTTG